MLAELMFVRRNCQDALCGTWRHIDFKYSRLASDAREHLGLTGETEQLMDGDISCLLSQELLTKEVQLSRSK